MERFTYKEFGHWRLHMNGITHSNAAVDRFAAYEDLGKTPSELKNIIEFETAQAKEITRLRGELDAAKIAIQAKDYYQSQGRLHAVPCPLGATLYVLFQGYVETVACTGFQITGTGVRIMTILGNFQLGKDAFLDPAQAQFELRQRRIHPNAGKEE